MPSVTPLPSVSAWVPLSSPSTLLSVVVVGVDEIGKLDGGVNWTI